MPVVGTMYSYAYNHARKEIIIKAHIGSNQPVEIVMSAEGFFQDIDFVRKDKKLDHWISEVRKRKDLPADHNFGADAEIKFNSGEWESKMEEDSHET